MTFGAQLQADLSLSVLACSERRPHRHPSQHPKPDEGEQDDEGEADERSGNSHADALHGYTYGPYYGIPPYCYTRCPAYYGYYAPRVYYRPYYQQRHYYFITFTADVIDDVIDRRA